MHRVLPPALLAVLLTAVGCGGGAATSDGTGGQIDLVAEDFAFSPDALSAQAGEQTTWFLTNNGQTKHNLTIEALPIDKDLEVGGMTTVTFTAEQPGDFTFFCEFHPDQMVGQLTVE